MSIGYYKKTYREIRLNNVIPLNESYGLIYYTENKIDTDILLFNFTESPWLNVGNVYGYKITCLKDILNREKKFNTPQKYNNEAGLVTLPPILTNHNNTLILHYNLNDNFNHRCYNDAFCLHDPSNVLSCNICYHTQPSDKINFCNRKKCKFLICNKCKHSLIHKYNKSTCPNCFISLI